MKKIAVTLAILLGAATVYGQSTNGDLQRQISVAKDFAPTVDRAAKLAITPQMSDTVTLRPDFDYAVRPRAWMQGFSVAPIRPATVDAATYDPRYPFYVKAGGGYPGQTLFDFYANTTGKGRSSLGFYLNHTGQLAKIDVRDRGETDAKSTSNSTGVFGTTGFGRYALSGEIGWDYDVVTLYGDVNDFGIGLMQHYSVPRASVVFGNDFTDLSYFNFRLGADGYLLEDRNDNKETGVSTFAEVGKRFSIHNLTLKAEFETYKSDAASDKIESTIVRVGPRYELRTENFLFRLGAVFAYEEISKRREFYMYHSETFYYDKMFFLPEMDMRVLIAGGAVSPYVTLGSSLTANSLRRLSSLNPYMQYIPTDYAQPYPATTEYNLRLGISGTGGSAFSYNVFVGADRLKHSPIFARDGIFISSPLGWGPWVHLIGTNIVPRFVTKRTVLTAGAEMEARLGGNFTVTVAGQYFKNKVKNLEKAVYFPDYTASLGMKYNHYDKLVLRAGVNVTGKYEFLTLISPVGENMPATADVSLAAQYNLSSTFGIFVEGANLANQKLYPYPFYQGVGINVSAGVKVRF